MELFSTLPTFTYNPINLEGDQQVEASKEMQGLNLEQVLVGAENQVEDMGMDTDDPILHSLQTLAEGRDFAENLGETQNFSIWEWFEQQ